MDRLLLLIIFLAFANVGTAQVADDFEFIDHRARSAVHGVSKVIGTDFLYVSHNQESLPMTSVILVNTLDNTIDTLLTTFWSTSRIQEHSDGSFEIFITGLFDYDIGLPGFYTIESDGNDIEVKEFFTYDPYNPDWNNAYYPSSIAKMEDGSYVFNPWDFTCRLNTDGTVDTLFGGDYYSGFHQNIDRKLYSYTGMELHELTDSSQDLVMEFSQTIIDIKNTDDYNDVLFLGNLQRWNKDFSEKIYEWTLPEEITSFYQLKTDDTILSGLIQDGNRFYIQEFDLNGIGLTIYENEYEDQGIKGFHDLGGDKLLLIGSDSLLDVDYNAMFFRNIDFNEDIEYQSRDISIDSFELFQFESEEIFQYVNSQTGDSIFRTFYSTELSLSFTNQSDAIVNLLDLKTFPLMYYWVYSGLDYAFQDLTLMPGESYTIDKTILQSFQLQDLVVGIPGADFRFNNHPNRITYPNFTAEFENIPFDVNLMLFPNPTSDILNIELDEDIQSIEIFNALGQLILFKSFGADLSKLDVSRLESGSYFIRLSVKGKDGYAVQQFVKM